MKYRTLTGTRDYGQPTFVRICYHKDGSKRMKMTFIALKYELL